MRIFLIANTAWSILNFRAGLMRALLSDGHEVVAVAPFDKSAKRIKELGVRFIPMEMDNMGTSPFRDSVLLWRLLHLMRNEQPEVAILYTIKPVIYGCLAARLAGVRAISVVTGLGTSFIRETWVTRLVEFLYRLSQSRVSKMFFLNQNDMDLFKQRELADERVMQKLPGEGIDLNYFSPATLVDVKENSIIRKKSFRFLLIGRMLWDKGVGEYVSAARIICDRFPRVECFLLGGLDALNPTSISHKQMQRWVEEGVVTYLGSADDVRPHIVEADCVVLPSYREGLSRTLLEAAAMERPLVTTDVVGCREVVEDGKIGFLCRPYDVMDLVDKMERMLSLSDETMRDMGRCSREKVEREFNESIVIQRYREVLINFE